MKTVASLFDTQADAYVAVEALAGSPFEDVEYRVHEGNVPVEDAGVRVFGIPPTDSDMHGSGIAFFGEGVLDDLDDGLARFLKEAVRSGEAVLVVAEVEEERADALEGFFREHGARTAQGD